MKRVLTSLALAVFAWFSIFVAPHWLFLLIVAMMACLCYYEFEGIARASGIEGPLKLGYITGILALIRPDGIPVLAVLILTLSLRSRELKNALGFSAAMLLGAVYIFLGWRWSADLREFSPWWLFFALSINWAGDIAAYYTGRTFGKRKLAPRVSPGKSWEGAAGSMVAAILYGCWLAWVVGLPITLPAMAALSAIANVAGQVGDLAESALKRGAGLKDSGTLLPGHGGFLDRLDSSLFTLPVVYHILAWSFR